MPTEMLYIKLPLPRNAMKALKDQATRAGLETVRWASLLLYCACSPRAAKAVSLAVHDPCPKLALQAIADIAENLIASDQQRPSTTSAQKNQHDGDENEQSASQASAEC